jgi:hypothetical protein
MAKWHEHPIVITMIKKWFEVIWYEHRQPYTPPTYHLFITYLPIYLPTYASTHLPTYPLIHIPTSPTYLSFPISYNLPTC